MFQHAGFSAAVFISAIILHLIYGFFLGVLYVPPKDVTNPEISKN